MGCCLSRSSGEQSFHAPTVTQERQEDLLSSAGQSEHYQGQQASNSTSSNGSNYRSSPSRQGAGLPLDQHYNQPIRPHIWRSKRRVWTKSEIGREREEFFDTRVSGRAEVWAALRVAVTLLREGETDTAQGIIDAAGITVPTGDLCEGCYDENGVLYRLPQCIVSDPDNIANDSVVEADDDDIEEDDEEDDDDDDEVEGGMSDRKIVSEESDDELIPEDVERRREEKGKMSERDMIKVQARLSDRDGPDLIIAIAKTQNVGVLARKVQNEIKIPNTQRVRIVYLGRMLRENEPLVDQGWNPGHVVNAMVVTRSSS